MKETKKQKLARRGPKLVEEDTVRLRKSKHPHAHCGGDVYFTNKWYITKKGEKLYLRWCVECRGYFIGKVKING